MERPVYRRKWTESRNGIAGLLVCYNLRQVYGSVNLDALLFIGRRNKLSKLGNVYLAYVLKTVCRRRSVARIVPFSSTSIIKLSSPR